jgi:hypothetical protein
MTALAKPMPRQTADEMWNWVGRAYRKGCILFETENSPAGDALCKRGLLRNVKQRHGEIVTVFTYELTDAGLKALHPHE